MDNRYKIIISNKRIYKEVELSNESKVIKIGSSKNCEVRFSKDLFFEDIEITLEQNAGGWVISSEDNTYISSDGVMKLLSKELIHGDNIVIKYNESNQEIFKIKFMHDFDFEKKEYDRVIDIGNKDQIYIGGNNSNNICLKDSLIANDTIVIKKTDGKFYIHDNKTRYGVYLNGNKIKDKEEIKNNDFISVIGYSFYFKFGKLFTSKNSELVINGLQYMDIHNSSGNILYPKFNRNTRMKTIISKEKISILDPSPIPQKPKNNVLASLAPAFAMLALTIVLRGIMGGGGTFVIFSVCTMSIGIITSILSFINNKKQYKLDVRNRLEKYNKYIQKKKSEIESLRDDEKNIMDDIYYSPNYEYEMVQSFSGNLFERNCNDIDFLHINIGSGAIQANRVIDYKKLEKLEVEDELAGLPEQIACEYRMIKDAPIICRLGENSATGVIGENNQLYNLMKNMVLDLCIRHYQSDVKIFFIISEENAPLIKWTRLLPQVQNTYLNVRNIVCNNESKNYLFEYLFKELSHRENSKETFPRLIIFVFDELGLKKHPISRYIERANELGFSFVFFENKKELLPIGCNEVIILDKDKTTGTIISSTDANCATTFTYDIVDELQASEIAIKLAPVYCEEVSLEGSLTKNISIYELLNIISVEDLDIKQRWNNSQVHKSMSAPIGVKSKNEVVYLDIHEKAHGPHGLVAGTTGSGKSEILQSYILSMATLYHPYEVSFMIIDFKGGGMVNQFKDLPHLVGAITNIDGREIERSLKSMKAELQKRQRCFAEAGVNHIDAYIKRFKNGEVEEAIPHLIVITDEFAELKAEQPEFMKELISAARIGRSLGVHLILATQKPAGQVNEQIWSNSKFKLCLKVQTKEDSNEVLKSPLAAEIKEPGRTYFQVGNNEIFELFQSAYSGSPAKADTVGNTKEFELYEVSLSGKRKIIYQQKCSKTDEKIETQLNMIVDYIKNYCEKNHIDRPQSICLPSLPDSISFEGCDIKHNIETIVEIGIYDNPDKQFQGKASLNLSSHNVMIIGSAQYGKTNLLQTIIRGLTSNYSPNELNLYIIDFGSMVLKNFEGLNHCGGVVCSFEDEKLKNLFKLLNSEIKERKEKLVGIGVSSFSSYKEAGYTDIPHIVLLIDNLTALKEMYLQDNDILENICREGLTVGISVIVANAQTSGVGYRYLSNFSSRIALFCNDSSEYNNLFDYCKIKPKNEIGRCMIEIGRVLFECQTYLSFEGEKEIDRVNEMKRYIAKENEKYLDIRARNIPVIPQTLTDVYVNQQFTYMKKAYHVVFGLDYSNVSPLNIDLRNLGVLAISGREGFGKRNIIRTIISALEKNNQMAPAKVVIIDDVSKKLAECKKTSIVSEYTLIPEKVLDILGVWEKELESRYEALVKGDEEYLNQSPLLLLIVQNQDVLQIISNDKEALARYKLITTKYRAMKVCIIFASIPNANIPFSAPETLKLIKEAKHFLAFEDLNNFKLIDIPLASTREFKKPVEIGDAYYIKENEYKKLKTVLHTVKK